MDIRTVVHRSIGLRTEAVQSHASDKENRGSGPTRKIENVTSGWSARGIVYTFCQRSAVTGTLQAEAYCCPVRSRLTFQ